MIYKTYEVISQLPAQAVLGQIKDLLSKECVKYRADNLSVNSTQTPIVLLNFDPRGHSRLNWVGVNPFKYVSSVNLRCVTDNNGFTKVLVRVNRFRAIFAVAWWATISLLGAFGMPRPAGAIFFVASVCAGWLVMVSFLGGYLIKKEISDHLKLNDPITG